MANLAFPDIMVDLETTGTQPEHAAIIQIAAVRFNLAEGTIDPKVFDRCLMVPQGRYWDEGTRRWWSKMPDVLEGICARMERAEVVMQKFQTWLGGEKHNFWSKPTSFDFSFMQSYCNQYLEHMPFHYRTANDMNTFIRARHFPDAPPNYEMDLEFDGSAHNGRDDCFHQIKVLMTCYEETKRG